MKNLFNLTGKIALVTGASSGLGVEFAKLWQIKVQILL